jgi:hypothetical protein
MNPLPAIRVRRHFVYGHVDEHVNAHHANESIPRTIALPFLSTVRA